MEWSARESLPQANQHALTLFLLLTLFFGLLTAVGYLFSPVLFPLMGYGFEPEGKKLGIVLEKFLIFLILIDGSSILFMAILQAQKRFFSLQLAPVFINIITILLLLFFHEKLGIYTLVWGFLLGTLGKAIFMAVSIHQSGFRFFGKLTFDRTKISAFFLLALPLLGSELIANVNLLVDQVMATSLAAGAVSTLRYAFRVNDMPIQIVILALSNAIFPFVIEKVLQKDLEGLRYYFNQLIIFLGLLTLPIIGLVLLFSQEVIGILFQRGAFDLRATQQTAQTLLFYNLGLFFYAYAFANGVFFSALKDNKPLFYMGCLSVILNIVFNLIFMRFFGVKGIALSTTFTMGVATILFMYLIKNRIKLSFARIAANFGRLVVAAVSMFAIGALLKSYGLDWGIDRIYYVPVITMVVLAWYFGVCWALKTEELQFFLDLFRQRK